MMSRSLRYTLCLIAFLGLLTPRASSQDLHFSQFDFARLNQNPALTGIFGGDTRFTGNYRSQWSSVPVNYNTLSIAAETKFYDKNRANSLFSGGLLFNFDQAGYSKLSRADLGLSASLTQMLGQRNFLTFGAQVLFSQKSFDLDQLTFDNQYNGDQFDSQLGTGENFEKTSTFFTALGVGLNWHYQIPERRSRLDVGIAFFNLNQPNISFLNNERILLPVRWNLFGSGAVGFSDNADLLFKWSYQSQANFRNFVLGAGFRIHLDQREARELSFSLGADYRLGDAVIPEIHLFWRQWQFGLTYDINTSTFQEATNQYGALEVSASHTITKVKPLEKSKICPIF